MAVEHSPSHRLRQAETLATGSTPPARPVLLVVDDDDAVRAAVGVIFQEEYDVLLAEGGRHALELSQARPVDVVILDLNMPELGGIEVLGRLKRQDPFIEVIILTGQATLETAREAIQLGAFAYLTKPFEMQEGRRSVRQALERRRQILVWRALENELQQRQIEQEIERVKGEIYATVIHDLNSPLTTALGLVELLCSDLETAPKNAPLEAGSFTQTLQDAATQLHFCSGIIKRYLNLMRRPAGQAALSDLGQVLADLKKLIRAHPAVRHNRLLIHVPDERLNVRINGLDLLQVLLNLTVNALQASEQNHHVEVYCRHLPANAVARELRQGPHDAFLFAERLAEGRPMVSVTVQDDGVGISPEMLPGVFESFYTTKRPGQGTGLGLTVVQRIVGDNGGALHLHSVVGEGTAFTAFFPLG